MTDSEGAGRRAGPSPRPRPAVPAPPVVAPRPEPAQPPRTAQQPAATAYTSTVVAPGQIVLGVLSGVITALVLLAIDGGLWPFAILVLLATSGTGWYLATVTLAVSPNRVAITQGRLDRTPRVIGTDDVVTAEAQSFSWAQCFGVGVRTTLRTTRLTVRQGPALCLTLRDGELIRISTPDPDAALIALGRSTT